MRTSAATSPAGRFWLASLIFVLVLASLGCMKASEDSMTLSSGMDKKVSGDYADASGGTYSPMAPEMGRQINQVAAEGYAAPAEGVAQSVATAESPGSKLEPPAGGTGALGDAGLLDKLETWMVPQAYAQDNAVDERYLVREGNLSLEVENYTESYDKINGIAGQNGGMVTDSHSAKNYDGTVEGWVKIRVPSEKFFDAWNALLAIGEKLDENITSQDVSREYVGYVSRLKNLLAEQATLQQMLAEALEVQRTRGLGEGYSILLDTQERLFNVTGEIEAAEDQLNALADRITRSTIQVSMKEAKALPEQVKEDFSWGIGTTAGTAYNDLLKNLRSFAQGFVYFIITCWTWLIPWAIVIWLGFRAWRKWVAPALRKYSAPATPAPPQQP